MSSYKDIDNVLQTLEYWKICNAKIDDGFFIKELMWDSNPFFDSMRSTQTTMFSTTKYSIKSEKEKFRKHMEEWKKVVSNPIDLNFLQFVRPGTAYGATMYNINESTGSFWVGSEEMIRPNSSWKKSKHIKPTIMMKHKTGNNK